MTFIEEFKYECKNSTIKEWILTFISCIAFVGIVLTIILDGIDQEMVKREKRSGVYNPHACIFEKNCK